MVWGGLTLWLREGCGGIFNSIRGMVGLGGLWVDLLGTGLTVPVL